MPQQDTDLKKFVRKEQNFIRIIGLSVQGNWWFATNEGEEDYKEIDTMFSNFNFIYIYGNPLLEDEIESTDKPKWSEVEECTDNSVEDSKFEQGFVPLDGTDI